MDLSAIIFVVLAVGWAGYLIPVALKHRDDLALSRPIEEFSDSVRVVGRGAQPAAAPAAVPAAAPVATQAAAPERVRSVSSTVSRESARSAAQRRRRVLGGLLVILVVVGLTSYLGYTPLWSIAVPTVLVVAFLVTARLTVRAQQVRRVAPVQQARASAPAVESASSAASAPVEVEPDLAGEDTMGLSRAELADAIAAPVLDDGGLWDPLPVTLPTYVNKARARRTVRTIEMSGKAASVTSSGHDAADSALAREAEEAAAAAATAEVEDRTPKAAGA